MSFRFTITKRLKNMPARLGRITTPHGSFPTPAFVPVATAASVRSLDTDDLRELGSGVILANTYHLHLRPGEKLVKRLGGIHGFMHWDGPVFTDSGGFQAFSLGYGMEHNINKLGTIFPTREDATPHKKWATIDDSGATFKSHIDGSVITLTPKKSMQIQSDLGADIILAFDECTSPLSDYGYTKKALLRTHRWAEECIAAKGNPKQAMYGIVQGGAYHDLREASASFISSLPFEGIAIGGSLGRSKKDMHDILSWVIPLLPEQKPRHLLGIGGIDDLFECVERGIDTFDCVTPTRWARRGVVFISPKEGGTPQNKFRINIARVRYRTEKKPIDRYYTHPRLLQYSLAYLSHLFIARELSFFRLASLHNLAFILRLMEDIRISIEKGEFKRLKRQWLG